jgi:hypothetical protein
MRLKQKQQQSNNLCKSFIDIFFDFQKKHRDFFGGGEVCFSSVNLISFAIFLKKFAKCFISCNIFEKKPCL